MIYSIAYKLFGLRPDIFQPNLPCIIISGPPTSFNEIKFVLVIRSTSFRLNMTDVISNIDSVHYTSTLVLSTLNQE